MTPKMLIWVQQEVFAMAQTSPCSGVTPVCWGGDLLLVKDRLGQDRLGETEEAP